MTWGQTSGKLKDFSYRAIAHEDAKCTINHNVVCVRVIFFRQTEKELSKLMTRAMTEGLEGLVLKDVNVMSTKVPFMLLTCLFCVIYMKLYMFYEIKLLSYIPLIYISFAIDNDEECNGRRQDNSMILIKKWTAFSLVNTRMRKERLTAAILVNLLKLFRDERDALKKINAQIMPNGNFVVLCYQLPVAFKAGIDEQGPH